MASSQSYADFERDYNTHLSKVRAFLAQPSTITSPNHSSNVSQCEKALQEAKQCIHAMRGLAEIEGDPFKSEDAKRKLAEIVPLENELQSRKGGGGGWKNMGMNASSNGRTPDENYLFGNRRGYAPPSMGENDVEYGDMSMMEPLTEVERRMRDSEHLLRESQALCAESEQIGAHTMEHMGRQREQLERSAGLIQQSLENTEQARKILKEMAHRALKNKIFLYCVIGVLVLANGAVLLHLWNRKK